LQFRAKKPSNPAYPVELRTLGDHLRKVRLDRGLSQPDVAVILKTSPDMVINWELNRNHPTAKFAKTIIDFMGHFPFSFDDCFIGKQVYYARLITGKTQKQLAKIIGCDASNLRHIELSNRRPQKEMKSRLEDYLRAALSDFANRMMSL